jgi:uncharacterized protein (TIGR03437 family)
VCRSASLLILSAAVCLFAQSPSGGWRRIGGTTLELGLASPAGGPVARVWFSADGSAIFARNPSGQTWRTNDLETWTGVTVPQAPPIMEAAPVSSPESGARTVPQRLQNGRVYSAGTMAWRSDDNGAHWRDISGFQGRSILGGPLVDLAVSPSNPDELVVAGENGIWRSVDAGASWAGLNDNLPNLPVQRLLAVPDTEPSTRIQIPDGTEVVWTPGERSGWRVAADSVLGNENAVRIAAGAAFPGAPISSVSQAGDAYYAGTADGRLFVSLDRGRTWRESPKVEGTGRIERIYAEGRDGRFAVAVTGSKETARVLRTVNAGAFWDDITADLPPGLVHGVTADRLTGAVYLASDAGLFQTYTDVLAAAPATPWARLREEPVQDVMLDAAGNQLYVAFQGLGVYAAMAPHRTRDPRVVNAGDRVLRAAAPGSLLSVIGVRVESARAGDRNATILAADDTESQVQLPYELPGGSVVVSMSSRSGRIQIGLPVSATSPSIFVDRDGHALITNADSGLMLDAASPARSNARIQILATGLGRVSPAWPAGLAAPLQDPPKVVAPIRAWLDRSPVEVLRATLAPGYTGLYLVELQIPAIVNRGPAELYIQAGDGASNRVQLWLEP